MKLSNILMSIVFVLLLSPSVFAEPVQWSVNGHYYDRVDVFMINWDEAKLAAESSTYMGYKGHLVTITSGEENLFITNNFGPSLDHNTLQLHWMGAYKKPGYSEPLDGWSWVTDEPWGFTNWYPTEPYYNDIGTVVDFNWDFSAYGKQWNSCSKTWTMYGYVVEYEPVNSVPEPTSLLLLGLGLVGLAGMRRKFQS